MTLATRYDSTLEWLYGLEARRGMDFRLERLEPVLERLGRPELSFPAIHVAGTNGKGSTAAMLHAIYARGGYRAGLYTSPHLLSFTERIRIGDSRISESDVVALAEEVQGAAAAVGVDLTFFEIATLMAFLEFRRKGVDLAIVETGLGGRLDATNVVRPLASVITSIGLEHCEILGDTVEAIAYEKAGIIKPGTVVVTGPLPVEAAAVVEARVAIDGTHWLRYGDDFDDRLLRELDSEGSGEGVGLAGSHQQQNASVALAVVRALEARFPVPLRAIAEGLRSVRWPGRLETVSRSPLTIVDAAHNPPAIDVLASALEGLALPHPRVLVFGVMADKDWRSMLTRLVPFFDRVVTVPVSNRRALEPIRTLAIASDLRPSEAASSAAEGLRRAREWAGPDGAIVVTGSIFLIAEIYRECGGGEDPFNRLGSA
jgi:dihydrofolate synthase/folylpolyglutamate synthase